MHTHTHVHTHIHMLIHITHMDIHTHTYAHAHTHTHTLHTSVKRSVDVLKRNVWQQRPEGRRNWNAGRGR